MRSPTILDHPLALVSILLAPFLSTAPTGAQTRSRSVPDTRSLEATHLAPVVLEGVVLEPDGAPATGAVVTSSAGGKAVTGLDGSYRLEVALHLEAESVKLTAAAGDDADGRSISSSVRLLAAPGTWPVDPLVLALGAAEPRWLPTFGSQPGAGVNVRAIAVFDDGSGPAPYASGMRWDGSRWSSVGDMFGDIRAMTVFDDGSGPVLCAGGLIWLTGGGTIGATSYLTVWDGSSWSILGAMGLPGGYPYVHALTAFEDGGGPALYAGGTFTKAGGTAANRVARWDGSSWSALGSGMNSDVYALTTFDDGSGPALYAGGHFTTAGGSSASRIARWDGTSWSALSSEVNGTVRALAVYDDGSGPALYAGGDFTSAGGVAVSYIARWDGTSWSALAGGMNGSVNALAVFDDGSGPVLVSGSNGAPHHIAKWNGTSWSPMRGGMNSSVFSLAVFDGGGEPVLYAGGSFTTAGNVGVSGFAKWDGERWSALGSGLNAPVRSLRVFDDGGGPALYAGGDFTTAGGEATSHIAKWDGTRWSALGSGFEGSDPDFGPKVSALEVFDDGSGPALFAGGFFSVAGGVPASHIARWDGSSWSAVGPGFNDPVDALIVFDDGSGPALYAGGSFSGIRGQYISKWNGSSWSRMSLQVNFPVYAFAVFDDGSGPALHVGGRGGGLLKWNGSSWSALGSGVSVADYPEVLEVRSLAAHDDGSGPALFVGGNFTRAGGIGSIGIARWNGSSWTGMNDSFTGYTSIRALAVFDDGSGPALYAGGEHFSLAGGVAVGGIAKWDGSSWSALGGGVTTVFGSALSVDALAVFNAGNGEALHAGHESAIMPDSGDSYLGRWARPPDVVQSKVRRR